MYNETQEYWDSKLFWDRVFVLSLLSITVTYTFDLFFLMKICSLIFVLACHKHKF